MDDTRDLKVLAFGESRCLHIVQWMEKIRALRLPQGENVVRTRKGGIMRGLSICAGLLALLLGCNQAMAAQVFVTKYASQAQQKVYVVKYKSQADCKVYQVKYSSQAAAGKWYYVKYASQADLKIHYVKYASQADLKVFFVKYASQANCRF